MSTEENKAIVRRFEEETRNRGNSSVVDELVSPDGWIDHGPAEDRRRGPADLKESIARMQAKLSDVSIEIGHLLGDGDRVAVYWTLRGTAKGDVDTAWGRFPASGKRLAFAGTTIYRLADGKIAEVWSVGDMATLLRQLGARVSPPNQGS